MNLSRMKHFVDWIMFCNNIFFINSQIEKKSHEVAEKDETEPKRLVALVAHDNMKQAMLEFVRKYETFFSNISIVSTKSTGYSIENNIGIEVQKKVSSGPLGGDQEIGAMVANDLIAGVIFFIDPLTPHPHQDDVGALVRICNVHNCPLATNPISGEALVHAFQTSKLQISQPQPEDVNNEVVLYI